MQSILLETRVNLTPILLEINRAYDFAEQLAIDLAEQHREQFKERIFTLFGREIPDREEPWLPYALAELVYDYQRALDRLKLQLLEADWDAVEFKTIRLDEPVQPQVERIILRHGRILAQRVNATMERVRQEAEGGTHYIWLTQDDDRVRESHAENDGLTFRWDDPPATGHPGDASNCRCEAIPIFTADQVPKDQLVSRSRAFQFIYDRLKETVESIAKKIPKPKPRPPVRRTEKLTDHAKLRVQQRNISEKEIENAIRTAEKAGKVSEKIGKYGTRQKHYEGENGIVVVVEKSGRNADKIVTVWRKK